MARTQTNRSTAPKAPDYIAWHVHSKGEKNYWTRVGASWNHQDGKGMTVQLETLPIGGRIVLRVPTEDTATRTGRAHERAPHPNRVARHRDRRPEYSRSTS